MPLVVFVIVIMLVTVKLIVIVIVIATEKVLEYSTSSSRNRNRNSQNNWIESTRQDSKTATWAGAEVRTSSNAETSRVQKRWWRRSGTDRSPFSLLSMVVAEVTVRHDHEPLPGEASLVTNEPIGTNERFT